MLNFLICFLALVMIALTFLWTKFGNPSKKSVVTIFLVAVLLIVFSASFKVIPTGHTGVRTTFGQIDSRVVQSGFNFKIPFVQSISSVNNKQQDKEFKGEIWGEASDKTVVFATNVIVTYQINPEKSAYIYSNVSDYKNNLIPQTLVNSAVKSAMVQLPSDQVTNRNKIESLTKTTLEKAIIEKYGADTIVVLKITIDNMDFEESYNQAIAEKQIARQNAEKQAIENQKAIDLAQANQEKAAIEAETRKITAQAEADAMLISSEAEAEAYRIKSAEITENLLRKWELDARKEHGWVTIQGVSTVVTGQ